MPRSLEGFAFEAAIRGFSAGDSLPCTLGYAKSGGLRACWIPTGSALSQGLTIGCGRVLGAALCVGVQCVLWWASLGV